MTTPNNETRPLVSLSEHLAAHTKPNCEVCLGCGWVCENHPKRPWDSGTDANCICGAGMPCICSGLEPLEVVPNA